MQKIYQNARFKDSTVAVDDRQFIKCRFEKCEMTFSGGEVSFTECEFIECGWRFLGAAALTIDFMKILHDTGFEGRGLIENIFDGLIRGIKPTLSS